jgi:16S rRNA processing protein RimM
MKPLASSLKPGVFSPGTKGREAVAGEPVAALPQDAVEVGRVMGAWGVKGGLKIKPFAADPQALFSTKRWYLAGPEQAGPRPGGASFRWPLLLRVEQAREHSDGVVATAEDLSDRNVAEALKGARIYVSRQSFPTPDDGEFYWIDLIGLSVHNRDAAVLGTVVGLLETGPHCVLRVQPDDAGAGETLIPFVDAYVDAVDLPGRRITVDWQAEY